MNGGDGAFGDGGNLPLADGATPDSGYVPVNVCVPGCGPMELCGALNQGNGLDDDCDGSVDEGCVCAAINETRPCFAGPPDRRDIGVCADGIETCSEFLQWGACVGGVSPGTEVCDGADNDCDNITDENLPGCVSSVTCPANEHAPPLGEFPLRGGRVYSGAGSNWQWNIECPASIPAELCPDPTNPNSRDTTVYFTASGAYRVSVRLTTDTGEAAGCAWTIYVQGSGLRVEMNWDTMNETRGNVDLDLHLHRWTTNEGETPFFTIHDCFYLNCQPDSPIDSMFGPRIINWEDHPNTTSNFEEICGNAPHGGGAAWRTLGYCRNPRLDVDTNGTDGSCSSRATNPNSNEFCAPENINVDVPILGMPYRVMVNYFDAGPRTGPFTRPMPDSHASVNIYCGGALRGAFGLDPLVTLRYRGGQGAENDNWYVADVVFFEAECGIDCKVYPLGSTIAQGNNSVAFGPPWSCRYDASTGTCIE